MTLAELKAKVDRLVALGFAEDEAVVWPDEASYIGAEPPPPIHVGDPGEWYVHDVEPSGDGWTLLRFRYRAEPRS